VIEQESADAGICYDPAARTWLLRMRSTCYGFGVAGDGTALRHLHWGAPLRPDDLATLARGGPAGQPPGQENGPGQQNGYGLEHSRRWERSLSWADELPDEYVPWGGLRYDEPSLKADFADGTRGIEWRPAGHRIVRDGPAVTLEADLADTAYPLLVTLFYRIYDGFDVVERWARIRHTGDDGTITVRQAHSANWWLPSRPGWRLRYLHGGWSAETQLAEVTLGPGKLVLESRRGLTSHQLNPWFALGPDGPVTEESGELWSGALAWSGSWKLVYELTSAGRLHACGGWNDFDWSAPLAPGGEIVLPAFAGLYSRGGFGAVSREWHAWQQAHVFGRGDRTGAAQGGWAPARSSARPMATGMAARPASSGATVSGAAVQASAATQAGTARPLRPVLYNSWEATGFAVTEAGQARLAGLAAGLGVECFVVDDGWFAGRRDDHAGLGDWTVDRAKFPRGLAPLIDTVSGLGMRFGLWVEPEMVNPDSDLYRAHPDWVYHFPERGRTQRRQQLVLNLARPDVAEWVFGTMDGLLAGHDIGFIKWDCNRHISEPGWPARAHQDAERIWVDHTRNLYAIIDALRAAHPGVQFETCSGGGGRVDLGILARTDQAWTSDNTDAWDRVLIQEGFTHAYSPQVMAAWVTDSPNPLTGRTLPLRFRFHVAMAGALGIGGDLTRWSDAERAEAAGLVATYKAIRPVVQQGRLYRLASARRGPLGAVEYAAPDGSETAVLAWWGPHHYSDPLPRLRLASVDPGARYSQAGTGQQHSGLALREQGLRLPDDGDLGFGSALCQLTRA
jgi:alpha-galactosidase